MLNNVCFKRTHHQHIAQVLGCLDAVKLRTSECWFGGGTAITLLQGEYRESVDIDFLISNVQAYRDLRHAMTGEAGLKTICQADTALRSVREIRADQYGIRTVVQLGNSAPIKFEIVLEGRIALDACADRPHIEGIACLTETDQITSKLLANSDRWADDSVFSRDLIDLVMQKPMPAVFEKALAKAQTAYGHSVLRDFKKAATALQTREGRLSRCIKALKMEIEPQVFLKQLAALEALALGSISSRLQ